MLGVLHSDRGGACARFQKRPVRIGIRKGHIEAVLQLLLHWQYIVKAPERNNVLELPAGGLMDDSIVIKR